MAAYCTSADLLIDQAMYSDAGEKDRYVRDAADSMDAKLGYIYVVPIEVEALPVHEQNLLKSINYHMATGRLLMSRSSNAQNTQVNAYALYLLRQAEADLMTIANGDVDLHAPRVNASNEPVGQIEDPIEADPYARVPTAWNPDRASAVTIFEKNFLTDNPDPFPWVPSENIASDGGVSNVR